jgi:uncharacterized repeat protein (TIGR03803 family)
MLLRRRSRMLAVVLVVVILPVLMSAAWAQSKYKSLHKFDRATDGSDVTGGLVFDQSGNLYGTAAYDGAYSQGTVFELIPQSNGGWAIKVLHSFTGGSDGGAPLSTLVFDQAGNLYGTTRQGGDSNSGVVFKLARNEDGSWTESVLYSFEGGTDGAVPFAGLIFDDSGNLYGTTTEGGGSQSQTCDGGCGTVFTLTPNSDGSWTETVLYSFSGGSDGATPYAPLLFDSSGNLYGTTHQGGTVNSNCSAGCGVVFELTPIADGSWKETVLHRFCSGGGFCSDGLGPLDSVVLDQAGNIYGTAESGGASYNGVVFRLTPNTDGGWKEKVLLSFNGMDGCSPYAGLITDQTGSLYGTTFDCGPARAGVVFKLMPNSNGEWHETILHAFHDHPGERPTAGVIFDAEGNLYGTTSGDGNRTFGSVFEIMP